MECVVYVLMINSLGDLSLSSFRNEQCFYICIKFLFQALSLSLLKLSQWMSTNGKGLCWTNKHKLLFISLI